MSLSTSSPKVQPRPDQLVASLREAIAAVDALTLAFTEVLIETSREFMLQVVEVMLGISPDPPLDVIPPEEGWAILDEAARRHLQMPADEFIQAWEAGKFDDDPDRPEVMSVAMLLPLGR